MGGDWRQRRMGFVAGKAEPRSREECVVLWRLREMLSHRMTTGFVRARYNGGLALFLSSSACQPPISSRSSSSKQQLHTSSEPERRTLRRVCSHLVRHARTTASSAAVTEFWRWPSTTSAPATGGSFTVETTCESWGSGTHSTVRYREGLD